MNDGEKQLIVNSLLKENFLVSPDFFDNLEKFDSKEFLQKIKQKIEKKENLSVLNKDLYLLITKGDTKLNINWTEFENARVLHERGKQDKLYGTFLDVLNYNLDEEKKQILNELLSEIEKPQDIIELDTEKEEDKSVIVLKSYKDSYKKREIQDFVKYYNKRYEALRDLLMNRIELQKVSSINKVKNRKNKEEASIIGIVSDKNLTKAGNLIIKVEDLTGIINVLFSKNKKELFDSAQNIVLDEVIGINGVTGDNIIFSNKLLFPDVPLGKELKKSDDEVYAAFTSDMHVGSNMFLENDFIKFIKWINGESGSDEQKSMAKKIKYLFVVGDLVDGVGIYPEQDEELTIKEISGQYDECARLLKQIRKDVKIIICGGNHDALRIAEPQPILNEKFAKSLYEMKNVLMVSNPSLINIHSSKDFEGFNILLYHGYSFDFYADKVESIRIQRPNISERADLILKLLLQKRHLAPTHGSTLFIPDINKDELVIEKIPDFIISGHIHRANVTSYNNVTLISCSCWQATTPFQHKVGHEPQPSKVPIVNLKTREIKIMSFSK